MRFALDAAAGLSWEQVAQLADESCPAVPEYLVGALDTHFENCEPAPAPEIEDSPVAVEF